MSALLQESHPSLSIVLPIYNQATHIVNVVQGYIHELDKLPLSYELILVTNACRDNSVEVCQNLSQQFAVVKHIDTVQGGWGHAVKLGLQEATGDLLCYTNSARTSTEALLLFVIHAMAYPQVVLKANRKIRDNIRRRLGSVLYNLEARLLFDLATWDINGTPKIFPRECQKLLKLESNDDLIDLEFNVICRNEGYDLMEVPLILTKRHGGKSTTNYHSAFKMYYGAFRLWKSFRKRSQYSSL